MIAEIIPDAYDAAGRKVFRPFDRRHGPRPTFPMGRYVSQPLSVNCQSIHDVRQFLCGCRGVSDEELFGKRDYWQPPEEFEIRKKGDCDDFALWTWRQLLSMGYDARVVFGSHGRYGIGHAWVQYCRGGKWFLMEPTVCFLGETLPRLSTTPYHPKFSVAWADEKLSYYAHEDRKFSPSFPQLVTLLYEWVRIWGWFWLKIIIRLPLVILKKVFRLLSRTHSAQDEKKD